MSLQTSTRQKSVPPVANRTLGEIVTLAGLLTLLGVTATAAGIMMIADRSGESLGLDTTLLAQVPLVDNYFVPGMLLVVLLGAVPFLLVAGLLGRFSLPGVSGMERVAGFEWPLVGSVVEGVGVVTWIFFQFLWLPETAGVQWVSLFTGAAIVILALLPAVRNRYRIN